MEKVKNPTFKIVSVAMNGEKNQMGMEWKMKKGFGFYRVPFPPTIRNKTQRSILLPSLLQIEKM
jgi:hypothetical protein